MENILSPSTNTPFFCFVKNSFFHKNRTTAMSSGRDLYNVVLRVERSGPALAHINRTAILVACVLTLLTVVVLPSRSFPTSLAVSLDDSYEGARLP